MSRDLFPFLLVLCHCSISCFLGRCFSFFLPSLSLCHASANVRFLSLFFSLFLFFPFFFLFVMFPIMLVLLSLFLVLFPDILLSFFLFFFPFLSLLHVSGNVRCCIIIRSVLFPFPVFISFFFYSFCFASSCLR